jgi:hypothetical protein
MNQISIHSFYRKIIVGIIFSVLALASASGAVLDQKWQFKSQPTEAVMTTLINNFPAMIVRSPGNKQFMFISRNQVAPQSRAGVLLQLKEMKGLTNSLKVNHEGHFTIFSFRTENQIHWFTTKGGHLILSTDNLSTENYDDFTKRVEWLE